jgi:hypothetical protein
MNPPYDAPPPAASNDSHIVVDMSSESPQSQPHIPIEDDSNTTVPLKLEADGDIEAQTVKAAA